MTNVSQEQKDSVLKSLAILGFLAVVIFGVWLAVQIVSLMPVAFSSLASIANSVYTYDDTPELSVTAPDTIMISGTSFELTWNKIPQDGTYTFTYECTEGVSVSLRENTQSQAVVTCGEAYSLGGKMTSLPVTINSERNRFADVTYTIAFVRQGDLQPVAVSSKKTTVVNARIPLSGQIADVDSGSGMEDTETEATPEPEVVVATPTPKPAVAATPTPRYTETVTYSTPVSNPMGTTDLSIKLLAVGQLDSKGVFTQRSTIDNDARGAFQFEVKNIGTKTSTDWSFNASLTNGTTYISDRQLPLRPQERAVYTLGYDNIGTVGVQSMGVRLTGGNNTNTANDSFAWAVVVTD